MGFPKQNGECHDANGTPIYAGDLLRTLSYVGRRRKRYYNYHVAVFDTKYGGLRMVPVLHLDPELREMPDHQGGDPLLDDSLASRATVLDGVALRDESGCLIYFDERPKGGERSE
jgi:hypothetical protein